MIRDNSDSSWTKWGEVDPYFGVLTDERFRRRNLDDTSKAQFFETGRLHVERVLAMAEQRCGAIATRKSALDFGCGVGRLVIPMTRLFEQVIGMDISEAMMDEARRNCTEQAVSNARFVLSDDELSRISGKFDFIHCYLVMQHIPVQRGESIMARLIDHLNENGVLAIHISFLRHDSALHRILHSIRRNFLPLSIVINILRGKKWNEPFIQMNCYDVNRILTLFSRSGIKDIFLEVVDAGGFVSAFFFVRKPTRPLGSVAEGHLWAAELEG